MILTAWKTFKCWNISPQNSQWTSPSFRAILGLFKGRCSDGHQRANIALVRPTYNTTGSGSISDCSFCGSYKTDRMKMESYSSSARHSRLPDIADPRDHHLPDPRDAPWLGRSASPTQTLTQAFYMVSWFETAHQPGKGKKAFQWKITDFPGGLFCGFSVIAKDLPLSQKNCLCTSLKSKSASGRSGIMEALISAQSHEFDLHRAWQEWLWLWRMAHVMVQPQQRMQLKHTGKEKPH